MVGEHALGSLHKDDYNRGRVNTGRIGGSNCQIVALDMLPSNRPFLRSGFGAKLQPDC